MFVAGCYHGVEEQAIRSTKKYGSSPEIYFINK